MSSINWTQFIAEAEAAGESISDFTPIPADTYEAKILEASATKTKGGNGKAIKDMIKATFVIEGGPHAGRRVWSNMVVSPESPKAMAILIRQLSELGVRPLLDQNASFEQLAAGLKDALATIKVSVGEWNGKPKNDVTSISGRKASSGPDLNSAPSFGSTGLPI